MREFLFTIVLMIFQEKNCLLKHKLALCKSFPTCHFHAKMPGNFFEVLGLGELAWWILTERTAVSIGCLATYGLLHCFFVSRKLNFDAPVVGDESDIHSALVEGYSKITLHKSL